MKHLMIDLETMDNKPTAAITAIGAVLFNPETGEIGETFYRRVSLASSVDYDCTMGADTVLWWLRQSSEARSEMINDANCPLDTAISDLFHFISELTDAHHLQVWGNGASFDNVILRHAANKVGLLSPMWNYWNDRDVRTVNALAKDLGLNIKNIIKFEGTPHHALYDAIHQAKLVSYVWTYLVKIASVK
ncbi:3'-5' exonuclease [Citrobacter freundii]|uniref:3'-5' exonuclease n=1 Tax=Citrobacter freundii TaxID=546 RepID=UPI0024E1195A|nr:3'-5' exonuclease [Citrobacter freundii]MEB0352872.1 3'-5' exonuclease [Citrobacter freundii]WOR56417.1 3'-5' exonuclease [Citrobacter freundii]HCQ6559593.1 3'-5' exoribonuclease [Citrobacter freundii]